MKYISKTLLCAAFISSLCMTASHANANQTRKTQGHYVGLDLVVTQLRFHERYTTSSTPSAINVQPAYSGENIGGGINYKYALNINDFFIAPGIFLEKNNASVKGRGSRHLGTYRYGLRTDIRNRLGLKVDVGYDINNIFALYVTGGYSRIYYRTQSHTRVRSVHTTMLESSVVGDWFYGAGLNVKYNDTVSFNLEYNRQSFLAKTHVVNIQQYSSHHKVGLNIFKAGLTYNF